MQTLSAIELRWLKANIWFDKVDKYIDINNDIVKRNLFDNVPWDDFKD